MMGAYQTYSLKKKIDAICESNSKDSIFMSSLIVNKKSLVSSFKLQPSLPPSLTLMSLLVFKGSWGFDYLMPVLAGTSKAFVVAV
jgi:hypothetical protein